MDAFVLPRALTLQPGMMSQECPPLFDWPESWGGGGEKVSQEAREWQVGRQTQWPGPMKIRATRQRRGGPDPTHLQTPLVLRGQ